MNRVLLSPAGHRNSMPVAVTGLGLITGLGLGVRRNWQLMRDGQCAVKSLLELPGDHARLYEKLPCKIAAYMDAEARQEIANAGMVCVRGQGRLEFWL